MPDHPRVRSKFTIPLTGLSLLAGILFFPGSAQTVAEGKSLPPILRLREGQQLVANRYLTPGQGSVLVRLRGEGWKSEQFESYPLISLGTGDNQIQVDAAGATVIASGKEERLSLSELSDMVDHLVLIRWKEGRVELWLDARKLVEVKASFKPFVGFLRCPTPTKSKQPYRILAFSVQRNAIAEKSIGQTMHSLRFSNEPMVTVPCPDCSITQLPSHNLSCGQMRPQISGMLLVANDTS